MTLATPTALTPSRNVIGNEIEAGYTRACASEQDLSARGNALAALGVEGACVYSNQELTDNNRARPGLR